MFFMLKTMVRLYFNAIEIPMLDSEINDHFLS